MVRKRNRFVSAGSKLVLGLAAAAFAVSCNLGSELNVCPRYASDIPKYTKKELHCLALNAYHEARGEGFYGMQLVSKVVLNRVNHKQWPNNICDVIYQPYQFSWTQEEVPSVSKNSTTWKQALFAARTAYQLTNIKSTYYHTIYVNPKWNRKLVQEKVYKDHIFFYSNM